MYVRNCDIKKVLIGVPKGQKHLRIALILENGETIVFSEATIANITRAYIAVKTHPTIRAIELEKKTLDKESIKGGYAECQLLETSRQPDEVEDEINKIMSSQMFLPSNLSV